MGFPSNGKWTPPIFASSSVPCVIRVWGTIHRDKGVMHYSLFTKTIDQIKDHCIWLTLYSWGEPFLNRRIHEFVAYAHQQKVATIMSSNLNRPLTPEMAENIIKSGLDVMIISIDGVTQEVYQVYRVGGQLDRVLSNLKLLVEKKKELGSATPYLEWQFIVMRQNEGQIPEARKLAAELGVDAIVFKKVDLPSRRERPPSRPKMAASKPGVSAPRPLPQTLPGGWTALLAALALRRGKLGRRFLSLLLPDR